MNFLRGKIQILALVLGAGLIIALIWFLMFGMKERTGQPDGVLVDKIVGKMVNL